MKRWTSRILTGLWIVLAALAVMVLVGVMPARDAIAVAYPDPIVMTEDVRASVAAAGRPDHDPKLPTAVIVASSRGANAADALAPYEVLSVSGEFNVYTAAPVRRPVPLSGGLDLVPDFSFTELERQFPEGVDVVIAPEVPDGREVTSDPVRDWLSAQASAGATVMGVCVGAELLARAGLLDGQEATSNWLALSMGGMEKRYPQVRWAKDVRYVDNGRVITTAAVLSGVDGALRILERQAGQAVARRAAAAVGWSHYQPGRPAPVPGSRVELPDAVALFNLGYREPARMGVMLTDGVGEIELASALRPYTTLAFVAEPRTVTMDGTPIRSRHGLTFVPRATLADVGEDLDRLVVPGLAASQVADPALAKAAAAVGLEAEYLHAEREFPFDAALHDVAATTDVATATWVAKTLEYPVRTELNGAAWPWLLTGQALAAALVGAAVAAGIGWLLHRRPPVRHFVRHAIEMFLAMAAGMMLLDPVWSMFWPSLSDRPDAHVLVMALDMTIGMGLWMWIRAHHWRMIAEMGVAMVAPFVVLLVPYYLGLLSGKGLMDIGHAAMMLAMVAVMLLRVHHYAQPQGWRWRQRQAESTETEPISVA
ncbi:DJ-1/PfpI family protein [Actinopolymorpha sp. B9G3]|uniref:DJ-1/PfpI family protein n=1 Tax=Actinopolymorpha sp. B9G3 TaxID=3158970 RepID=UPI0032D8D156